MKVRFLGVGVKQGDGVSIQELFNHLTVSGEEKAKLGTFDRYCYMKELDVPNSDYIVGLFVTIKDHKKFCELQKGSGGKFIVKVSTVNANSNLMDFNFFAINRKNGQCLYQHYHNSCSSSQFAQFLQGHYQLLQAEKSKAEKSGIEGISKRQETAINKKYKKGLTWSLMVRPEKFDDLLKEMENIRDFEIDFETLRAPESDFVPLNSVVKKERRKFSFVPKTSAGDVSQILATIIKNQEITEGKIIHISENPDNFGEYDYDDVAGKINSLDVDKFHKNWVVSELLRKTKEYDHIFGALIKP